jgi:hypothetical protein
MATVRLSNELRAEIIHNAKALFDKRVAEVAGVPPKMFDGDYLLDKVLSSDPEMADVIAKMTKFGWTAKDSTMKVRFMGMHSGTARFAKERMIPSDWRDHYGYSGLNIASSPENKALFSELYNEYMERSEAHKAVTREREAFVAQVKTITDGVTTLKQALGMWPGLWDLVPYEAKSKHNEINEREKREKREREEIVVDLDSLNAGLVTAKIVEGVL